MGSVVTGPGGPAPTLRQVRTSMLDVALLEYGDAKGRPVILLHGFPYDVGAYAEVAPIVAARGCRVLVPYLRGYGPTRFLDGSIPRSGEQAALGHDLLDLIEVLGLEEVVLGGYDWGGRAACIAAALRPDRVAGLVSVGGFNMMPPPDPSALLSPRMEHALWYQYFFHREDAHRRFAAMRDAFCRYIWSIWSPCWQFDDETFARTARSFDNPDFIDVVIHSYRHRWGLAPGDPALADLARAVEARPPVEVPTIAMIGEDGGMPIEMASDRSRFVGSWSLRRLPGIGHNLPQEAPHAMADAILSLVETTGKDGTR